MSSSRAPAPRRRPGRAALLLLAALLVAAYSMMGYAMVASFSVSNPERLASYRTAAWIYLALLGLSVCVGLGAIVVLIRWMRDMGPQPPVS